MNKFQSEAIKSIRQKNNMSQKALAMQLGVSDRAISKWETGLSSPSAQNLISLAKIFGVQIEYFIDEPRSIKKSATAGMESISELYKIGRGPSSSHMLLQ